MNDKQLTDENSTSKKSENGFNEVSNPAHYCKGRKYEPKDVIRDWDLNFNLGNAVKYISRSGRKGSESGLTDLMKAKQYIEFEIAYLSEE